MRTMVFVAGLGHSGSTLLDIMLGCHERFTGLGEIYLQVKPGEERWQRKHEIQCSCWETMADCPFWGPTIQKLRREPQATLEQRYRTVVDAFFETYGDDQILVDSSKCYPALKIVHQIPDLDVKVLFMLKDVRAWVCSIRDSVKLREAFTVGQLMRKFGFGVKALAAGINRTSTCLYYRWYKDNKKFQRFFQRDGVKSFQLGYEELALATPEILAQICEFLEITPDEKMLSLQDSTSHNASGNRMRNQKAKRERIMYDNRWFYRSDWRFPSMLLGQVNRYNAREVYKNTREGIWSK